MLARIVAFGYAFLRRLVFFCDFWRTANSSKERSGGMEQERETRSPPQIPPLMTSIRNHGEPLRLEGIEPLAGFVAEAVQGGQQARVWVRSALTSDEPLFHRLVVNLDGVIQHMVRKSAAAVNLRSADTVLLVIRPDGSGELWVDAAAVTLQVRMKRAVKAMSAVFEVDIADITGMNFPCVTINERDKVVCLFRVDWGFGLAFDFNPEGALNLARFSAELGTLHRTLRYRHLYQAMNDHAFFDSLLAAGWFPFVEIINAEFRELAHHIESGFDITDVEAKIVGAFDTARLSFLLERWIAKPHFAAKEALLKEAVESFVAQKPASTIKIILTEIEGVLNDAYRSAHGGGGAKLKRLLEFARSSAEERAGGPDTLLFPAAFGRYLEARTFANFDPSMQMGSAESRHAVGHGAATQDSYTMARALQAILTLDQLAFYT